MAKLLNKTKNLNITDNLTIASSFVQRFKGLMFKESIHQSEALLIPYNNSIHTFFMNFPIDVIFLNKDGKVQKVIKNLKPNKIIWPILNSSKVIEMHSGMVEQHKIEVGDILNVES